MVGGGRPLLGEILGQPTPLIPLVLGSPGVSTVALHLLAIDLCCDCCCWW